MGKDKRKLKLSAFICV